MFHYRGSLVLTACFLFSGCFSNVTQPLLPEAAHVVVRKSDPPADCEEVGAVQAPGGAGDEFQLKNLFGFYDLPTAQGITNGLKNEAHKLGGNWVTLTNPLAGSGTAYRCGNLNKP
jgi:hypothetical protein